jgi:hypothetical protein
MPGTEHTYIGLAPMDCKVHLYKLSLNSLEKVKSFPKERRAFSLSIQGSIAGNDDRVMSISVIDLGDGSVFWPQAQETALSVCTF